MEGTIKEETNQVFFDEWMNLDYKRLLKYNHKKKTIKNAEIYPCVKFPEKTDITYSYPLI
jgi:hypothetical protein